jgi:hypothetical protein
MSEAKRREPRPRARDKTHQSACQMKAQLRPLGLIALALIVQIQSPTREKDFVDDRFDRKAIVALWVRDKTSSNVCCRRSKRGGL